MKRPINAPNQSHSAPLPFIARTAIANQFILTSMNSGQPKGRDCWFAALAVAGCFGNPADWRRCILLARRSAEVQEEVAQAGVEVGRIRRGRIVGWVPVLEGYMGIGFG